MRELTRLRLVLVLDSYLIGRRGHHNDVERRVFGLQVQVAEIDLVLVVLGLWEGQTVELLVNVPLGDFEVMRKLLDRLLNRGGDFSCRLVCFHHIRDRGHWGTAKLYLTLWDLFLGFLEGLKAKFLHSFGLLNPLFYKLIFLVRKLRGVVLDIIWWLIPSRRILFFLICYIFSSLSWAVDRFWIPNFGLYLINHVSILRFFASYLCLEVFLELLLRQLGVAEHFEVIVRIFFQSIVLIFFNVIDAAGVKLVRTGVFAHFLSFFVKNDK